MSFQYVGEIDLGVRKTENETALKRRLVYMGNNGENSADLCNSGLLPALGSTHPKLQDTLLKKISVSVSGEGKRRRLAADLEYSLEANSSVLGNFSLPGTGRAFNVRFSSIEKVIPFEFSYEESETDHGRVLPMHPVVNSAGSPISASTLKVTLLLKFSYYLSSFDPAKILQLCDSVNAEECCICNLYFPPETGLMRSIVVSGVKDHLVKIDIEIEYDPEGFLRRFANRGFFCLEEGIPARICMGFTEDGPVYGTEKTLASEDLVRGTSIMPADEMIYLDEDGKILLPEDGEIEPEILEFQEKKSISWRPLCLPVSASW